MAAENGRRRKSKRSLKTAIRDPRAGGETKEGGLAARILAPSGFGIGVRDGWQQFSGGGATLRGVVGRKH